MQQLHETANEIICDAHVHLVRGGSAYPVRGCIDDLDEIINEEEYIPREVVQARLALGGDDPDTDRADRLLREYLRGTDYDPDAPESNYPEIET